jgi:hypothetical protein
MTNDLLFQTCSVDLVEQSEQQRIAKNRSADQDLTRADEGSRAVMMQSPQAIFQQLGVDPSDLSIVLGTAERILPSITEFVRVHLGVE